MFFRDLNLMIQSSNHKIDNFLSIKLNTFDLIIIPPQFYFFEKKKKGSVCNQHLTPFYMSMIRFIELIKFFLVMIIDLVI